MPQATLINPSTGQRQAVTIGSPQAQQLFGQGYVLETGYNQQNQQSTYGQGQTYNPLTPPSVPTPTTPQTNPTTPYPSLPNFQVQPLPSLSQVPMPSISPEYQTNVTAAQTAYQQSLMPTTEETGTQSELENLMSSFRTAYQNTAGQAIPLDFIVGQQKSLEQRNLTLAEPLSSKLARLQAMRTSAMEASKFALERADVALSEAKTGATAERTRLETFAKDEWQRIFDQNKEVLSQINTLTDNARQNLTLILGQAGISDTTPGIDQMATAAGLDPNLVKGSIKANNDLTMFGQGYKYVNTPAERDRLKKQGYDIQQLGGRTYAKPPAKTGSVAITAEEKEIKAFQSEAGDLIARLESAGDDKVSWSAAFDILKTKYPSASNDTINAALGGGIPYSNGTFDTAGAWGRAKKK